MIKPSGSPSSNTCCESVIGDGVFSGWLFSCKAFLSSEMPGTISLAFCPQNELITVVILYSGVVSLHSLWLYRRCAMDRRQSPFFRSEHHSTLILRLLEDIIE